MNIVDRIWKEMGKKIQTYGIMGSETVTVKLVLTKDEKEEFWNIDLDEHYWWEFDNDDEYLLIITWKEDI